MSRAIHPWLFTSQQNLPLWHHDRWQHDSCTNVPCKLGRSDKGGVYQAHGVLVFCYGPRDVKADISQGGLMAVFPGAFPWDASPFTKLGWWKLHCHNTNRLLHPSGSLNTLVAKGSQYEHRGPWCPSKMTQMLGHFCENFCDLINK